MKPTTRRITWLDHAKAMAIILVVAGHFVQSYCPDLNVIFKIIYSFHMPAFFVLSGFLFSEKKPFKNFIVKKAKSLLLPYVVFSALLLVYRFAVNVLNGSYGDILSQIKENLVSTLLIENDSYFMFLWFFPCLFTANIFLYFIFRVTDKEPVRALLCLVLAGLMLLINNRFGITLPLCADTAGAAAVWLYIGHLLKIINIEKIKFKPALFFISFALLLCVNVVMFQLYPGPENYDSFRSLNFVNYGFAALNGLFGSLFIVMFGFVSEKISVLAKVGQASSYIYGLHFLLLGAVGKILFHISLPNELLLQILNTIIACVIIVSVITVFVSIKDKMIFRIKSKWKGSTQ